MGSLSTAMVAAPLPSLPSSAAVLLLGTASSSIPLSIHGIAQYALFILVLQTRTFATLDAAVPGASLTEKDLAHYDPHIFMQSVHSDPQRGSVAAASPPPSFRPIPYNMYIYITI